MDEQMLAALGLINTSLTQLHDTVVRLAEKVDRYDANLLEFTERFEEVLTRLENERRLDWNTGD